MFGRPLLGSPSQLKLTQFPTVPFDYELDPVVMLADPADRDADLISHRGMLDEFQKSVTNDPFVQICTVEGKALRVRALDRAFGQVFSLEDQREISLKTRRGPIHL